MVGLNNKPKNKSKIPRKGEEGSCKVSISNQGMPEECILGVVYGLIGPALCQIPNQKGRTNGCWLAHTNTTSSASTAFANMLITAVYRRRQRFVRHVAKFNQRGMEGDSFCVKHVAKYNHCSRYHIT